MEGPERYSPQGEIHAYVRHVVERFGLEPFIQLQTKVTAASFDETSARWTVETEGGETFSARSTWCSVPGGSTPRRSRVSRAWRASVATWYQTADWPKEGVDLGGKRVGVIGTGSSATPLIPIVAEQASQLLRLPAHCQLRHAGAQRPRRRPSRTRRGRRTTPNADSARSTPSPATTSCRRLGAGRDLSAAGARRGVRTPAGASVAST